MPESPSCTPELVPWKPKFDLDTPEGRVCLLSEKVIDAEFTRRLGIRKRKLKSYGKSLGRYYELKTHEHFGTLPRDIVSEVDKRSNSRTTNQEFIDMGMEMVSQELALLPDELQKLEEQCFQPLEEAEHDALSWIYTYVYRLEPSADEIEKAADSILFYPRHFSSFDFCRPLYDLRKTHLAKYFVQKSNELRDNLAEERDKVMRLVDQTRATARSYAKLAAAGGPIYKVDIPSLQNLPDRSFHSPHSLSGSTDTKTTTTAPSSEPQGLDTRASDYSITGLFKRVCETYCSSRVNKNRGNRKRSKHGGKSNRSW